MRRYVRDLQGRFALSGESWAADLPEVEQEMRSFRKYGKPRDEADDISLMHDEDKAKLTELLSGPGPEERALLKGKARADAKRGRAQERRRKAKGSAQAQQSEDELIASLDGMKTMDVAQYRNHANPRVAARARQILNKRS